MAFRKEPSERAIRKIVEATYQRYQVERVDLYLAEREERGSDAPNKRKAKGEALIISADKTEGNTYSDMLKSLKKYITDQRTIENISGARKTTIVNLLLTVKEGKTADTKKNKKICRRIARSGESEKPK